MRLVKICNIIVNLDNIAIIRPAQFEEDRLKVYAYTTGGERIFLGRCDSKEDVDQFMEELYDGVGNIWAGEVAFQQFGNDDEDKELWG